MPIRVKSHSETSFLSKLIIGMLWAGRTHVSGHGPWKEPSVAPDHLEERAWAGGGEGEQILNLSLE